jgi:tetratricopeptide (TPR) repeat protein
MRTLVILILISLFTTASYGQKKKKGAEPAPVVEQKPVEGAPDPKCGEAPFSMESPEIYSVFTESARTKDYETALLYGPWLACAHPKKMAGLPSYSGDKMFERLADVYEGVALKKKDPASRTRYLDSAAWAYTRVLEIFANGGTDLFQAHLNRGRFYQKNADYIDNAASKASADYEAMYKLDKKRITELADGYYVTALIYSMLADGRKDDILAIIKETESIAPEALKETYNQVRDRLFSNPEERVGFLQEKVKANPKDIALLNELYDVLLKLKRNDEARKIAADLYKLDASYTNTMRVADNYESNGDYKNAIKFYMEAETKAPGPNEKKELYLKMADNYINTSDLKSAREFARKALAIDNKFAKAYFAIARIYAQSVSACGGTMDREDKVVYWLAIDYAERAKSVDPSSASYADQQIKVFSSAAPNAEEKFFKAWKPGQKIRVDASLKACYGWIGEETTIR